MSFPLFTCAHRAAALLGLALVLDSADVAKVAAGELGKATVVVEGVVNPESAVVGTDGRTYVSCIGQRDQDGDGIVAVVVDGKPVTFAKGLDDPKGITAFRDKLFVADKTRVWAIDRDGTATVFAAKESFPVEPLFLNDIAADEAGTLYVSDSGLKDGGKGKVFSISSDGKPTLVVDETKIAGLKRPNGVLIGRDKKLLLADVLSGILYRVKLSSGAVANVEVETVAEGLGGPDGIVEDNAGNLFIGDGV